MTVAAQPLTVAESLPIVWWLRTVLTVMVQGASGLLQGWDVLQDGSWLARVRFSEWMRLEGDTVFIVFGAVPLFVASCKAHIGIGNRRTTS